MSAERAKSFRSANGTRPEQCMSCSWLPLCYGGCKRDITFNGTVPENYFCPSYRFFFEYASQRLMEVASAELKAMRERRF